MTLANALWFTKYRPTTVQDCILPTQLKASFQSFVDEGFFPNLLIVGGPGMGKTTVAKALCKELDYELMFINGSLNGGIDNLRTEMQQFASTMSISGNRKCIIVDEADYLSNSTQAAMRTFMEEFTANCSFILTANFQARLIEPLWSRCTIIDFAFPSAEKKELMKGFMARVMKILDDEGIPYEGKAVAQIITKYYPDFRRTINELQRYSSQGEITSELLSLTGSADFEALYAAIKAKDFPTIRKWVGEHSDLNSPVIFRRLYEDLQQQLKPESIPALILTLAQYQYQAAFAADQEINLAACCVDIMASAQW